MFTGIVEALGTIVDVERLPGNAARVRVAGSEVLGDAVHGCSIAVDGVCLTVTDFTDAEFTADVMSESLNLTTLGQRSAGDPVNLERAVRMDTRLGGHLVSGHVDGLGTIAARAPSQYWERVRISVPAGLAIQIATKGSVTVDGVSLTVTAVGKDADGSHWFELSLIPTTLTLTSLGERKVGDHVNIETDVIAKYVQRLVEGRIG